LNDASLVAENVVREHSQGKSKEWASSYHHHHHHHHHHYLLYIVYPKMASKPQLGSTGNP
jgi:hypothetical protein